MNKPHSLGFLLSTCVLIACSDGANSNASFADLQAAATTDDASEPATDVATDTNGGGGAAGFTAGGSVGGGLSGWCGGANFFPGGSGGTAGSPDATDDTVGGAGGALNAGSCPSESFARTFGISTSGPEGQAYEGDAVVEYSTGQELIFYFEESASTGAGLPTPHHFTVSRNEATLPIFSLGAKVWLTKDPAGDAPWITQYQTPDSAGWAFNVRDKQGGTMLFGASMNSNSDAAPLQVKQGAVSCVQANSWCPDSPGGSQTFYDVDVQSDPPTTLHNGQTAGFTINGNEYDVTASSMEETPGTFCAVSDYYPDLYGGVWAEVWAKDLPALVAGLPQGDLPACRLGTDSSPAISFDLNGFYVGEPYSGPVVYSNRNPDDASLVFSIPHVAGTPPTDERQVVLHAPEAFAEPAPGQQFWLDSPLLFLQILRNSQNGPPLVVSALSLDIPSADPILAQLTQTFGVPVTIQRNCDYLGSGDDKGALWDVIFGTNPPQNVTNGTVSDITLNNQHYKAWVGGLGGVDLEIYPAGI